MPPAEQERVLLRELESYQPELLERPRLVVGTKADMADARSGTASRSPRSPHQGVRELVGRMAALVARGAPGAADPRGNGHAASRAGGRARRADRRQRVPPRRAAGRAGRRAATTSPRTRRSLYIDHQMKRLGVPKLLARAGAQRRRHRARRRSSRSSTSRTSDVRVVAKIGTSSLTDELGVIDEDVIDSLCEQLVGAAQRRARGGARQLGRGVGGRRRARAARRGRRTRRRCRRSPRRVRAG